MAGEKMSLVQVGWDNVQKKNTMGRSKSFDSTNQQFFQTNFSYFYLKPQKDYVNEDLEMPLIDLPNLISLEQQKLSKSISFQEKFLNTNP